MHEKKQSSLFIFALITQLLHIGICQQEEPVGK